MWGLDSVGKMVGVSSVLEDFEAEGNFVEGMRWEASFAV